MGGCICVGEFCDSCRETGFVDFVVLSKAGVKTLRAISSCRSHLDLRFDGLFALGGRISRIILFSPETALHQDTSLQLGPTPHPTTWGGSPTPRRMLAVPPDGWGGTNGCIGPRGWVASPPSARHGEGVAEWAGSREEPAPAGGGGRAGVRHHRGCELEAGQGRCWARAVKLFSCRPV